MSGERLGARVALAAVGVVLLLAFGWLALVHRLNPAVPASAAPAASDAIRSIELPDDPAVTLPAALEQHCTGCHSPELILTQPPMNAEKWAGEVKKMREVYHAPVAPTDDTAIVAALVGLKAPPTPAR